MAMFGSQRTIRDRHHCNNGGEEKKPGRKGRHHRSSAIENERRPLRSPFRCWTVWFHLSRFVCSPEVPDPQEGNAASGRVFQSHGNIIGRDETGSMVRRGTQEAGALYAGNKKRAALADRPPAMCQL
nr:hypothetical protein [Mesorhizobium loti]